MRGSDVDSVPTKRCSHCVQWLDVSAFYRARARPDGLDYYCKSCRQACARGWRAADAPATAGPTKRCSRCAQQLGAAEFGRNRTTADGLDIYCTPCRRDQKRAFETKARARRPPGRAWNPAYSAEQPGAKRCSRCGQWLDLAAFYRNRSTRDGLDFACTACRNATSRAWKGQNAEHIAAYLRSYAVENPERIRALGRRRQARKQQALHVPFTVEQLIAKVAYWGNRCWLCGGAHEAIDHVKPLSKGGPHILANLRPICKSCNSRKHNKWPLSLV